MNAGAPLWCLLDTGGANLLYLTPAKAAALNLHRSSDVFSSGPLDTQPRAGGRTLITMDVGPVHREKRQLYIKELGGLPDDGLIGAAVFADFIVELDLLTPTVRLHSPASFRYSDHGPAVPCDLWSSNPHVMASLTIDDREFVNARMTIDTGAGGMADAFLTPRFNDRQRGLGRNIPWLSDKEGWHTCRIGCLAVGPATMDRPLIALPPAQGFGGDANAPDGLLAVNFLRQYRLFIDYSRKQVLLEPCRAFGRRTQSRIASDRPQWRRKCRCGS